MVLKTASKPIASMLKNQAGRHPRFRQFIIDIGQGYRRFTTTMQRGIDGHRTTDVEIRPLNEKKAIRASSGLIGVLVVFPVAAAGLTYEMHRRAKSKLAKTEERVEQNFKEIDEISGWLQQKMDRLEQTLNEMEQKLNERGKGLPGSFELKPANSQTHESNNHKE